MYTALIIEPRKHTALGFVLNNFVEELSNEWNIILFHGNTNIEFVNDIIANNVNIQQKNITLVNLNIDNISTKDYSNIFYSKFIINNKTIYDYIPTETFLVFQTDTLILNKENLGLFLKYDYVGAPWQVLVNNQRVGNGGFSLRKKSKMLEIIQKEDQNLMEYLPEDVFFSCPTNVILNKPTLEEARLFSVEELYYDKPFGCHKPWNRYYSETLITLYPQVKYLFELQ